MRCKRGPDVNEGGSSTGASSFCDRGIKHIDRFVYLYLLSEIAESAQEVVRKEIRIAKHDELGR